MYGPLIYTSCIWLDHCLYAFSLNRLYRIIKFHWTEWYAIVDAQSHSSLSCGVLLKCLSLLITVKLGIVTLVLFQSFFSEVLLYLL